MSSPARSVRILGELIGHKAGCGHPQDDEGDLAVFLVTARRVEVSDLGLRPQGIEVMPGDSGVLADRHVDVVESLNSMALAAEFFIDPVEPLGALFGPLFVSGLQLLNCLVVALSFLVDAGAPQHREQVVAAAEGKGVNGGAPQEHRDRSHYSSATLLDYIRGDQPLFNKHVLRRHRREKVQYHCVTTEKVPAKYRSLKMAEASLGK